MSDDNLNQQDEQPEDNNTGKIIGTILLVLVGVVLVLVVAVVIGRALAPEAEATATNPPSAAVPPPTWIENDPP